MTGQKYTYGTEISEPEYRQIRDDILQFFGDGKPHPLADCLLLLMEKHDREKAQRVLIRLLTQKKGILVKTGAEYSPEHPFGSPQFSLMRKPRLDQ